MADRLSIEITAAVAQALQGLQQTAQAISSLQATTVASNAAGAKGAAVHESALQNLWLAYRTAPSAGAMLRDVGVIAGGVAVTVGKDLAGAAEKGASTLGTALTTGARNAMAALNGLDQTAMNVGANLLKSLGPLIGIGAALAVGVLLEQAIAKTIAWDDAIAVLSRDLQYDTTLASTWAARAQFVGITAGQLETAFTRLSVAITTKSEDLKSMGIAVADSNGKLRSTADILTDLTAWFSRYAGSAIAADQATKLFGRGNAEMAVLLGLTKEQMAALDAEANRLGLIIGTDQLNKWRAFDAEVKAAGFTFQGLELALGHGIMPVIAILGSAITDFVSSHLKELVAWLAEATGWIVGLVSALTGVEFKFSDFAAAISQVSTQVAQLGTIQDLSNSATSGAAAAARDATEAITNQIDALRQANQLLQEQTDAQIAVLQAQGAEQAFLDQQTQSKQRVADDQKNISKLQSDYNAYLLLGDLYNAQQVNDQLISAQQQLANDTETLQRQTDDHTRQGQIDALKATQKMHNDETNDLITQLQNRARAISQANATTLAGTASTVAGFTKQWDQAGKNFTDGLNQASVTAGQEMGKNIKDAMTTIGIMLSTDPGNKSKRDALWHQVGDAIGNALVQGIADGIGEWWQRNAADPAGSALQGFLMGVGEWLLHVPSHQAGGTVPGPIGQPRLIIAHGGERVGSNHDLGNNRRTASTVNATFNIYGATDTSETARVVRRELNAIMGIA